MSEFIEFNDVKKIYHVGEVDIPALDGVNFQIKKESLSLLPEPAVPASRPF